MSWTIYKSKIRQESTWRSGCLIHFISNLGFLLAAFVSFCGNRALTTFRKENDEGEDMDLESFEVAALMNLVATDSSVEEAVSLIPSLSRFPEAAIDEILDLIRSTMIRIVS